MANSTKKKTKKLSRSKLIKKLDNIFSKYIRLKDSPDGKYVECYTCGKKEEIKKMQCGHFISRANYRYRWDENNCKPQCVGCNIFKHGNYPKYTLNMIRDYGKEKVEEMVGDAGLIRKFTTSDIETMITEYETYVNNMKGWHERQNRRLYNCSNFRDGQKSLLKKAKKSV